MGSPWKMFTQAQGQELINGTNSTWTSINGVNGRKFTSKTDSSKYIFLPAGGWYWNTTHYVAGSNSYYWSSIYFNSAYSQYIYFHSTDIYFDRADRWYGYSVRAIQ